MYKGRMLWSNSPKDYKSNGQDVKLGVYGLFNTEKVQWTYHVISYYTDKNGSIFLTEDICGRYLTSVSYDHIRSYGKKYDTLEEGRKFIEDYKCKWETGSNNTSQEIRDKKINEILD